MHPLRLQPGLVPLLLDNSKLNSSSLPSLITGLGNMTSPAAALWTRSIFSRPSGNASSAVLQLRHYPCGAGWKDYFTFLAGYRPVYTNQWDVCFFCGNATLLTHRQLVTPCNLQSLLLGRTTYAATPHPTSAWSTSPASTNCCNGQLTPHHNHTKWKSLGVSLKGCWTALIKLTFFFKKRNNYQQMAAPWHGAEPLTPRCPSSLSAL